MNRPFQQRRRLPIGCRALCLPALLLPAVGGYGAPVRIPGLSESPFSLSGDGRYIAYVTSDAGVGSANKLGQVAVKDLDTGVVTLASVSPGDAAADGNCDSPSLSSDGRSVAFVSVAANLLPGGATELQQVYVRNLQTGATIRASANAAGIAADNTTNPGLAISGDGRLVAFESFAHNLLVPDGPWVNIVVKDVATGAAIRGNSFGPDPRNNHTAGRPALSADGRFVSFVADVSGKDDILTLHVKNLATGAIVQADVDPMGVPGIGRPFFGGPGKSGLSGDGRFIAFETDAANLVPGDVNKQADVFVKDLATGAIVRASVSASGGESNGASTFDALSENGRYVAFETTANNLVPLPPLPPLPQGAPPRPRDTRTNGLLVKDLKTGRIFAVVAEGVATRASLTADGSRIAYVVRAGGFGGVYIDNTGLGDSAPTPGDLDGDGKVNVRDATLTLQIAVGILKPTAAQTAAGDLNGDGKVDVRDATALLRKAVGLN